MRPISIEMENFGPYRQEVRIDFTRLGSLFLVCGPTGSGKSTIFDAMAYALYGTLPGERKGYEQQIGSQHAEIGAAPRVTFEFALGDKRFRVERVPPYGRRKRDGGIAVVPAAASLWRCENGTLVHVADKVREVTAEIESRIGLSFDEFSKVILLPQGAFEEFLQMNSSDRVKVLEKLFPVRLHDAVSALAARKAGEIEASARSLDEQAAGLRAQAGEDAEARLGALRDSARDAGDSLEREIAARGRLATDLALERERLARRRAAMEAAATLERLESQAGEQASRIAAIEAARTAARLSPLLEEAGRLAAGTAASEEALGGRKNALAALESARAGMELLEAGFAGSRAALAGLSGEIALLESALRSWAAAEAAQAAHGLASEAEARAKVVLDADEMRVRDLEARAEAESVAPGEEQAAREASEEAADAFRRASARAGAVEQLAGMERVLAGCRSALDGAARDAEASAVALDDAARRFAAAEKAAELSHAARLAAALEDGQPCPVCGSKTHPAPAVVPDAGPEAPEPAALKALRAACDKATAASAAAGARRNAAADRLAEAERGVVDFVDSWKDRGGLPGPEAMRFELRAAESAVQAARAAVASLEARKAGLAELSLELASARRGTESSRAAHSDARVKSATALAALEAAREHAGNSNPEVALAAAKARHAEAASALEKDEAAVSKWRRELESAGIMAREAEARLAAAREAAAAAAERFLDAAAFEGLTGEDPAGTVRATALERDKLAALVRVAEEYSQALAGARSRIDSLAADLTAEGEPEPDMAALEAGLESAAARVAERTAAAESTRGARDALQSVLEMLESTLARRKELDTTSGTLLLLARILKGDTQGCRLPFKNFALALYFSQVVAHATTRLTEMSDGRYALVAGDSGVTGNAYIGLGVSVLDSWTGKERPTQTLSGGERFLTSVSLALGLADTIRERSGGVSLEAVFMDEGFGSLDDESLDRAITVLDRIRGARTIGIVSHVAELRARIPSRIEVRKGHDGSTLRIV